MKKTFILFLMLIMLSGCGIVTKKSSKSSTETANVKENENIKEEAYTLTSDEENKLKRIIELVELNSESFEFNKLNDQKKMQLLFSLAISVHYDNYNKTIYDSDTSYLKKNNLEMLTREYFGPDAKFKMVDINCFLCDRPIYIYDSTTGGYYENPDHPGHGGSSRYTEHVKVDTVKKGDIVSVKYNIALSSYIDIGAPEEFYTSLKDSENYGSGIPFAKYCWGDEINFDCDYEKMIKENPGDTYSYNFKKDGDKFYFIGYTKE